MLEDDASQRKRPRCVGDTLSHDDRDDASQRRWTQAEKMDADAGRKAGELRSRDAGQGRGGGDEATLGAHGCGGPARGRLARGLAGREGK
jgi:hypothetical protein